MRRVTLSTFRKVSEAEERMIRATMPRTSERAPEPLVPRHRQGGTVITVRGGLRLVRPLTATLAEVARA